jgi:mycoredoxin
VTPAPEAGKISGRMEVTVYSAFWCPDCREAKRFLAQHNIPYKEVDIETTPGAAQEVIRQTGKRAIPQFVIDGEWVQPYRPGHGFLYEEMSARLGIKHE